MQCIEEFPLLVKILCSKKKKKDKKEIIVYPTKPEQYLKRKSDGKKCIKNVSLRQLHLIENLRIWIIIYTLYIYITSHFFTVENISFNSYNVKHGIIEIQMYFLFLSVK